MDDASREKYIETLYQHREFLNKTRVAVATSFDKHLLTFASGGLYLSVFFTNSLGEYCIHEKEWIAMGWIFLVISIVSMLFSIYFSVKAHQEGIEIVDDIIDDCREGKSIGIRKNFMDSVVSACEIMGGLTFVLGISSLAYFYFSNLK